MNTILNVFGNLFWIFVVVVVIVAIIYAFKNENQYISNTDNRINKVVNVTLTSGIIGLLFDSPQRKLNDKIKFENQQGWRIVQIIPSDSGNLFLVLFRFMLLIITFLLFTTANGYYLVCERTNLPDANNQNSKIKENSVNTIQQLKSMLKPNEMIVQFKSTKEYKILKREQYLMDKELHLNNDYNVIDENISH